MKATRARLQAQGVDVIDLGAGDSGLAPPPAAVTRLQEVVRDPSYSSYPFQRGLPEFREAVGRWMQRRFGLEVDPWRNLLPLVGSKDGIAHLPFAFMDPGDAAIIPDPGYTPYVGGVTLAGGAPHLVALRPEHDFLVPLGAIPDDVAARTRILYLNYPNNPTAATAPDAYYREAIDFCRERGALLVHDHAYSELAFDGYKPRSIFEFEGAWDVAIEVHSMSKTYNMTGWRIGWAVANPEIVGALQTVKTFVDTGQFLAVQAGAAAALDSGIPPGGGVRSRYPQSHHVSLGSGTRGTRVLGGIRTSSVGRAGGHRVAGCDARRRGRGLLPNGVHVSGRPTHRSRTTPGSPALSSPRGPSAGRNSAPSAV
jgi:LL-diaminopimelate aminotransferase